MFIREMSDAHLEICPYFVPPMKGDEDTVMVLSGDICTAATLNDWAYEFFESLQRFKAVVYIPGNHEYYRDHIDTGDTKIRNWLADNNFTNVHFLNGQSVVIDDVAFIGATLWTDIDDGNPISAINVRNSLNDYHVILAENSRKLSPNDTIEKHMAHKQFLFEELCKLRSKVRKTVVLSHHAPSELSVHRKYFGNPINAAFHSRLDNDIAANGPDIWFHGHTHDTFAYMIGRTAVACNPRGYAKVVDYGKYIDLRETMEAYDPDDPDHGMIAVNFSELFHNENYIFNPFFRIEV